MRNPYFIETPAVISFSGGRSSGFMLHEILKAYDYNLPEDIKVIFCNTGLEHHQTYEFIHRIEQEWCDVIWLEYETYKAIKEIQRDDGLDVKSVLKPTFKVIDYDTASRNGEPFDKLIEKEKYLPNTNLRMCTATLKIRTMRRFMRSLKYDHWNNVVGLRADENRRVQNIINRDEENQPYESSVPMSEAGHGKQDVTEFWNQNFFDLNLPGGGNIFGNCVGCFLKGTDLLEHIAREEPHQMQWWINAEGKTGNVFCKHRSDYKTLLKDANRQIEFDFTDIDSIDCFCTD